jgi:hypothetical protein
MQIWKIYMNVTAWDGVVRTPIISIIVMLLILSLPAHS